MVTYMEVSEMVTWKGVREVVRLRVGLGSCDVVACRALFQRKQTGTWHADRRFLTMIIYCVR